MQETGEFQTAFGHRLRTLRERAGLPQEESAHRMGLSSSSYARIERGQQAMRTNHLPALVAALEVDLQEFFAPLRPALSVGMTAYLRAWIDDWQLNNDADAPWVLPQPEAIAYCATTRPGSLRTADAVVDWLARGQAWAKQATYATTLPGWATALEDHGRITGQAYWRSPTTMTALGLVPISAAQSSVRDLDLLGDAAERRDAEVPSGVLRPVSGSRGLTIWWVPGLTRWAEIPVGLHLRAMIEAGTKAAEDTALRVLSAGRVSMDAVRGVLTE